jgi:hypothetical protein
MNTVKIILLIASVALFASCAKENISPNNPNADQNMFAESLKMEEQGQSTSKGEEDITAKGGTNDDTGLDGGPLGGGNPPITDPNTDEDQRKKRKNN